MNGGRGATNDTNDTNKDTNTYEFVHTYPDMTGEKDLLAGNGRRQGRNPPNRPNRGRQNPNAINVRRNPNRAARGVLGRGPAPQPQPVGPQPQPVGPQPQPGGPTGCGGPQPGGPRCGQPGGPGRWWTWRPRTQNPVNLEAQDPVDLEAWDLVAQEEVYHQEGEEGNQIEDVDDSHHNLLPIRTIHNPQIQIPHNHQIQIRHNHQTQIHHNPLICQHHQEWELIQLQGLPTNPQTQA